jgi:sarcosine oxidase subunit gamma
VADTTPPVVDVPPSGKGTAPPVMLAETQLALAWNLRGDSAEPSFVGEAQRLLGLALPQQPNTSVADGECALLWLGPRSWLYLAGRGAARHDFDTTRHAVNAARGALFDVSASYVGWTVSGSSAARVLNRSCPLDLHPRLFPPGRCAQSMLGHVNALFYKPGQDPRLLVLVARSFAADAWSDLCTAAAADGYGVGPGTSFGSTGP